MFPSFGCPKPDSKEVCHPLCGPVLDRMFCQGFEQRSAVCSQHIEDDMRTVTFSIRSGAWPGTCESSPFCHCHQLLLCCFQIIPVSAKSCLHPSRVISVPSAVKSRLVYWCWRSCVYSNVFGLGFFWPNIVVFMAPMYLSQSQSLSSFSLYSKELLKTKCYTFILTLKSNICYHIPFFSFIKGLNSLSEIFLK